MKRTLQSKIAAAMWAVAASCIVAAALTSSVLIVRNHEESLRQQLQATATALVSLGITHFSELSDFEEMNRFIEDALGMDRIDKVVRVYDRSLDLIFTTAGSDYDTLPSKLPAELKKPYFATLEGRKRKYESIVVPYEGERSGKTFYLQVAIPLPHYTEILEGLWWQSALLLGFLMIVSAAVSSWLSKRLLVPVEAVAKRLGNIDPARMEEWRPIAIDAESKYLKAIVDGINLLAERTRAAMAQMRRMGRYVAHEMRTPLTILRGEAETVLAKPSATAEDYERVLRSSLEEIDRLSEIVDTVLSVGDGAAEAAVKPVSFDLSRWLRENLAGWEKTLGRPIDLDLPRGEVAVKTDPKLLFRLIDNLVRNVRIHTPSRARCTIFLERREAGAAVKVMDNGPGLPPEAIESLNAHGGFSEAAGIGLNLCHRIAELAGMRLAFSNRPGGGLAVTIAL